MSTLSRLETGLRRPTLQLLIPLAQALHVALDQLVEPPATGDPRMHLRPTRRRRGGVIVPLSPYLNHVKAYKQIIGPCDPELVTHRGYEWLYVLSGRIRLIVRDEERCSVRARSPSSTPANLTGSAQRTTPSPNCST
ncbi:helix-turn-helix domain-containing protein [Pseudonocardia sp. Cha107L01]|uniref:helix-turn-helix domain-containing protein n=1 Tax=Pseudonocardia sp. Cha107L01 TaxID=3457576 RepID=UPI00403EC927